MYGLTPQDFSVLDMFYGNFFLDMFLLSFCNLHCFLHLQTSVRFFPFIWRKYFNKHPYGLLFEWQNVYINSFLKKIFPLTLILQLVTTKKTYCLQCPLIFWRKEIRNILIFDLLKLSHPTLLLSFWFIIDFVFYWFLLRYTWLLIMCVYLYCYH